MLRLIGYVDLPRPEGRAFDHAAVCLTTGQVFVAHTAADQLEQFDGVSRTHTRSIPGCVGGSGVLYAPEPEWIIAASRGSGQLLVLDAHTGVVLRTITVGPRPNGVVWDPLRQRVLVADVEAFEARCVDPRTGDTLNTVTLAGRPRWGVYDNTRDCYWVNIREPALVQGLSARDLTPVATLPLSAHGPHGLAFDPVKDRLMAACDDAQLVVLAFADQSMIVKTPLAGPPDVIWLNERGNRLYVAIGQPGCVQVVETASYTVIETIATEPGATTLAFDTKRQRLYVFLPVSGRAAVYEETASSGIRLA